MRDFTAPHKPWRRACAALAALLIFAPVAAAEDGLAPAGTVSARRALDGDTLELADGQRLRLAGILAPKVGDAGAAREVAAIAAAATAALETLAAGTDITLLAANPARDRHGRLLAHARTAGGAWLQDELLRRGLARVFTQPGLATRSAAMLALEGEARAARRGLWALASYAVLGAEEAQRGQDRFAVVEGRVLAAARTREFLYLNFERDWRRDFTIGFDAASLRDFRRAGRDPALLEGKRLRVRGWIVARNGPYIAATHPEQIELLD
jgi:endonuclease YncB( thermonuclease family)